MNEDVSALEILDAMEVSQWMEDMSQESDEGMKEVMQWKSSFDRFGDDLTELIFSFLPIGDKFRLQCLSKQIRSLVLTKQYSLRISPKVKFALNLIDRTSDEINGQLFDNCLGKLVNLSHLEIDQRFELDSPLLQTITDKCRYLSHLSIPMNWYISYEAIKQFGQKFGQRLKSVSIFSDTDDETDENIKLLLSLTPKLVSLKVNHLKSVYILDSNADKVLPKLKEIEFNSCKIQDLIELQPKYGPQLVRLRIDNRLYLTEEESLELISGFKCFHKLRSLQLLAHFSGDLTERGLKKLCKQLTEMAANCRELRRISIDLSGMINDLVLEILRPFTQLTSLDIALYDDSEYLSFDELSQLTRLRRLSLKYYNLSDQEVEDLVYNLPQLEYLVIKTADVVSESALEYISQLSRLRSLDFISVTEPEYDTINDDNVALLLTCCLDIRRVVFYNRMGSPCYISPNTIRILRDRATMNPKNDYFIGFIATHEKYYSHLLRYVPANMTIDIDYYPD